MPTPLQFTSSLLLTTLACGSYESTAPQAAVANFVQQAPLTPTCDFSGTWGIEIDIPVAWSGSRAIQGGNGQLVMYLKAQRSQAGEQVDDVLQACGTSVSDYRSQWLVGGELFGVHFPDALFDSDALPKSTMRTQLNQNAYNSEPVAFQLGIDMPQAQEAPWPKSAASLTLLDMDADDNPGITIVPKDSEGYAQPPTGFTMQARVTEFYTVVRNVAQTFGEVKDCNLWEGFAKVPNIDGRYAINAHVLGCKKRLRDTVMPCAASEVNNMDRYQPVYDVQSSARVVMRRLAPDATCKDVREYFRK